ncbi:MAG: lysophospholipid acyltransferase family protein [Planctomycetota bacterium]
MRLAIDWLVYCLVRVLIAIVQALPVDTGVRLAGWLAWLLGDVFRIRQKVVDENLAHAFPEMSPAERVAIRRQMWRHLFLLVLEVAHTSRKIHETNWRDYVRLAGDKELVELMLSGRPNLIVTGHFGNFEVGGYVLGILGFPTYTVARTLDNPFLDRFLNRFRGGTGQSIIPKNGGFDQIVGVLARGGTMTLLADQYAGPKGCWVEFFGRPASAHKAIALLSLENNAPVSVCGVRRLGEPLRFELRRWETVDPSEDRPEVRGVREMTQWYMRRLEDIIRQTPGQYWWLHRRWKDTREKRGAGRRAA